MKVNDFTIKILVFLVLFIFQNSAFCNPNTEDNNNEKIINYLDNIKSSIIEFSQTDNKGKSATGALVIHKPHQFRINYDAPYPLLVLGNKNEIIIYDFELEQTTRLDPQDNLFNFLLMDKVNWKKNFLIKNISDKGDILVANIHNNHSDGNLFLILKKSPMKIAKMILEEVDGKIIEISFDNIINIKKADKKLFSLPNTQIFGKPKRLSNQDIINKCN